MPRDKKILLISQSSTAGLKSDASANLANQNVIAGKVGISLGITLSYSENAFSSVYGGVGSNGVAEQSFQYPATMCYDHQFPGHNGTYHQSDASCHQSCAGASYNGTLLYFIPGYNAYTSQAFLGADGQNAHLSAYTNDARYQVPASWGIKSAMGSNGSAKSNSVNSKRSTMTTFNEGYTNYPLDMQPLQSYYNISQSALQSHLCSLNKVGAGCQCGGIAKGYLPSPNFSSLACQNQALFANYSMIESPKIRESEELTCGPRAHSSIINHEESEHSSKNDQYNLDGFQTKYEQAKFYIIKSYSEDDVHKCVKYDVWSSTPNGNKKLDVAFQEAVGKTKEARSRCPVFLFFSVNGSGQFVGVAEMMGPVVFDKDMDFWQLDKWSGFFPVKWHIIKDIPNTQLRHIILENNDNRPVTYTRDTQEVGLQQGLEMLNIFKSYPSKTSLIDDLSFYENREKLLKARRNGKVALQLEKNSKSGEGSMGSLDALSLINLTRNLSLNTNMPKDKPST